MLLARGAPTPPSAPEDDLRLDAEFGWTTVVKVRTAGRSKGREDKYYEYHRNGVHHTFRSKKEVRRFLHLRGIVFCDKRALAVFKAPRNEQQRLLVGRLHEQNLEREIECIVCSLPKTDAHCFVPCGHTLCGSCTNKHDWANLGCPTCQGTITGSTRVQGYNTLVEGYGCVLATPDGGAM